MSGMGRYVGCVCGFGVLGEGEDWIPPRPYLERRLGRSGVLSYAKGTDADRLGEIDRGEEDLHAAEAAALAHGLQEK